MSSPAPPAVIPAVQAVLAATDGLSTCFEQTSAPTAGAFEPLPPGLHPQLAAYLAGVHPGGLYRHQREALDHVLAGRHTVVATRTSSGKSLIYSVPVANRLLTEPDATALFLFPQKALANDQLGRLREVFDAVPGLAALRAANPNLLGRYDGATKDADKPGLRTGLRVMLTNPDTLQYAVTAWHEKHWGRFLANLRYVVVDECHEYRGIFGTNVAFLFRRLRALCRRYGSAPTFVATSATVRDPAAHLGLLTGLDFTAVGPDRDGSTQGGRKVWLVRPGEHPYDAGRKLTLALAEAGLTVLTFCLSRTAAERMMARAGRENTDPEAPFVRVYRAGLRADEREEIERGLKARTVRAVFTTSALELGIDIGAVDAVVCVGLPHTMMSLWQRAGRAGRGGRDGAVVLIPAETPIDAYYADHPAALFGRGHEPLVLNLGNRRVTHLHYACAAKEAGDETKLDTAALGPELAAVKAERDAGTLQDEVFYLSEPHRAVRVRGAGDEAYTLVCDGQEVGEIDPFHLLHEAPRNGIYSHGGVRYRVQEVSASRRQVTLAREMRPHFTTSNTGTSIRAKRLPALRRHGRVVVARAVLDVTDYLRGVTEKHLSGDVVRTYPGSGGMPADRLPTEGVMLRLEKPLWAEAVARLGEAAAKAALDTTARLFGSLFPTVTGPCDSSDYDAAADAPKDGPAAVYLYDAVPFGVGLAAAAYDRAADLVGRSAGLVRDCPCEADDGCFRCVKNPRAELPASKVATAALLDLIAAELARPGVTAEVPDEPPPTVPTPCPKCGAANPGGKRFCGDCGEKLEADA